MNKLRDNLHIFTLLSLFLLVKLFLLFKLHDIRWDESVFIGMGKYIYSFGKVGLWEVIRPIGLPLILGFFWKIGLNVILFGELISLLFSMGCIYLVYRIGSEVYDKKVGMGAAGLMIMTPVFIHYSSYALTGISSTFFALLAFYFYFKKKFVLVGVFSAIAFLFRFPQGMLLLCFLILINLEYFNGRHINVKNNAAILVSFILVIIPYLLFNYFMYGIGGIFRPFLEAALHQSNIAYGVGDTLYNIFYYFIEILKQNPLFIFFIISLIGYSRKKFYFMVPFFLFLVYFTVIINKQIRFVLVFLPYICVLTSYGIFYSIKKKRVLSYFFVVLLIFSLFFPVGQVIRDFNIRGEENRFYEYFVDNPTNKTILTTTPVFVAYSDIKMIPFYNNVDDAVMFYNMYKDTAEIVIYNPEFYPCFDEECYIKRDGLFKQINSTHGVLLYGQGYYIYT